MKVRPPKERFTKLTHDRWDSWMWLGTTPEERSVYLVLIGPAYNGRNNGGVTASIGYLVKMTGMGRTSIVRALRGLTEKGLILRTLKGAVFRGKPTPSTFEICEYGTVWNGKDYDVDPRLDWTVAKPPLSNAKRSRKPKADTTAPRSPSTGSGLEGGVSYTATGLMACTGEGLMGHVPVRDSFIDSDVYSHDKNPDGDREDESWRTEALEPEELNSLSAVAASSSSHRGRRRMSSHG